jgi:hypothetical protein
MSDARILYDLPEDEYHALPRFSSSGIRHLRRSAAHYRWVMDNRREKREWDEGHAVHTAVLGRGMDVAEIPGPWTTTVAKEAVAKARAAGLVPLKPEQVERIRGAVEAVRRHPVAGPLLRGGEPEVSVLWTDDATGVECKARIDYVAQQHEHDFGRTLVDLKTTGKSAEAFERSVVEYGYDSQGAHYRDAWFRATGTHARFLHVVVETSPPHGVKIYELDTEALRIGLIKRDEALEVFRHATTTGTWASYDPEVEILGLPEWEVRQYDEGIA